jgi:hypothetical protein
MALLLFVIHALFTSCTVQIREKAGGFKVNQTDYLLPGYTTGS